MPIYIHNPLCYNPHNAEQQYANIKMDLFGGATPTEKIV